MTFALLKAVSYLVFISYGIWTQRGPEQRAWEIEVQSLLLVLSFSY